MPSAPPLLAVRRLRVEAAVGGLLRRGRARLIDDLHFNLAADETLGVLGEAGSGKSTLARTLVGALPAASGQISFDGQDLTRLSDKAWRPLRRKLRLFAHDSLLDAPGRKTVARCLADALKEADPALAEPARAAGIGAAIAAVGLAPDIAEAKLKTLDEVQRRRVALAQAIIVRPAVLVCDEPTRGLAAAEAGLLLDRLAELRRDYQLSMIFVSQDASAVQKLCDRVLVLCLGRLMEQAPAERLFEFPQNPYTRALLDAAAQLEPQDSLRVPGEAPDPNNPPSGCVFRPRCALVDHVCASEVPVLRKVVGGSYSACHFAATEESPMTRRRA